MDQLSVEAKIQIENKIQDIVADLLVWESNVSGITVELGLGYSGPVQKYLPCCDSQPFRSLSNSLPGTFAPWPFRSLAFSRPGTFVPPSELARELSQPGTFALNFRTQLKVVI